MFLHNRIRADRKGPHDAGSDARSPYDRRLYMVTRKARKSAIKARPGDRATRSIDARRLGRTGSARRPLVGDVPRLSALVQCLHRYVDANPSRFRLREETIGSRRVLTLVLART
jgi:hypothetical protein